MERLLRGNTISQWFLTFPESQHSLKKASFPRKCCWEINRKRRCSGHDRTPRSQSLSTCERHTMPGVMMLLILKGSPRSPGQAWFRSTNSKLLSFPYLSEWQYHPSTHPASQDGTLNTPSPLTSSISSLSLIRAQFSGRTSYTNLLCPSCRHSGRGIP